MASPRSHRGLSLRGRVFSFHGISRTNRLQWTRVLEARDATVLPHWLAPAAQVFVLVDWWVDTLPELNRAIYVTEYWLRESLKLGDWLDPGDHPFFSPPAAFGGPRASPLLLTYPSDYDDGATYTTTMMPLTLARLPCSPLNLYDDVVPLWPYFVVYLREPTTTTRDLAAMLQRITGESRHPLNCLQVAIDDLLNPVDRSAFFDIVLPTMKQLVLDLPYSFRKSLRLLPPIDTSESGIASQSSLHEASLYLSRTQLLPLLSAMFLAVFPAQSHVPNVQFPWFSMEQMFSAPRSMPDFVLCKAHKTRTILEYFLRFVPRFLHDPSSLEQEIVTFTRVAVHTPIASSLADLSTTRFQSLAVGETTRCMLSDVRIETTALIEDLESHLQIDFANKYAGGGVMNGGAVQEEIRFMLSPELMASCLVFARLEPNESFVVHGSERFSNYTGYGGTFRFGGSVEDKTPIVTVMIDQGQRRRRQSVVVGVDAISYNGKSAGRQYTHRSIFREMTKAHVGFAYPEPTTVGWPIATGNWGCGVFRGDPELKFLIQWLAVTLARRSLVYVIFEQTSDLEDKMTALLRECEHIVQPPHQHLAGELAQWIYEFLLTLETELNNPGASGSGGRSGRSVERRGRSSPGDQRDRQTVLERAIAFIRAKATASHTRPRIGTSDSTASGVGVSSSSQTPASQRIDTSTTSRQRSSDHANGHNGGPQLKQPKLTAFWK